VEETGYDELIPVFWRVQVEMPAWRTWSPGRLRRLRSAVANDPSVKQILEIWPLWWRLLRRHVRAYVTIEVAGWMHASVRRITDPASLTS
jgi:hypothetical protein